MKTYHIYHIPSFRHKDGRIGKIGCSEEADIRVNKQGYTEYEILEEHDCIYKASERERELQKQYGYPVDKIPYYEMVKMTSKGGKIGGPKCGKIAVESGQLASIRTKENQSKGGKIQGPRNVESGQWASLRTPEHQKKAGSAGGKIGGHITGNQKRICPYCGLESNGVGYFRWHGDRCKHKPIST